MDPVVPSGITRVLRVITLLEDSLLVGLLALMIILAAAQIVLRNVLGSSFGSSDQLLRILVLWVGLLGAVAASRDDKQINIDMLSRLLPVRARLGVRFLVNLFTAKVNSGMAMSIGISATR